LALFLSVIYLCLLYGMYVPDWEYEVPTEPSSEPMIFSVSVNVFYFFLTCFYLFLFIYRLKKLIYVHLFEYVLG
jgi:hypothetical protein